MRRRERAGFLDEELVRMLEDEPELLAIADALVETQGTRRRAAARRRGTHEGGVMRRRLVLLAAATMALAAAVAGVVGLSSSGSVASRVGVAGGDADATMDMVRANDHVVVKASKFVESQVGKEF